MAEEGKEDLDAVAADEAAELQKMLGEAEQEEQAQAGLFGKIIFLLKKLLPKSKKSMIIVGAGALVLLLVVGGGLAYFLLSAPQPEGETAKQTEDVAPAPKKSAEDALTLKTGIYTLEPFFLPLGMGSRQAVRFVNLKVNLLLSNRRMEKDVEKNVGPIRQNIYKILKRKKMKDYTENKAKLENRLKQEIVTLANSFLLSGTGTVEDVFFTQFVVK